MPSEERAGCPRIANLIFFIRGYEPRGPVDLLEPVLQQIRLVEQHHLPATFMLQPDALLQERFVAPLKALGEQHEIGAWLELCQSLAERAGVPWRGRWAWDWHSHVDFPLGYPPEERERMIDLFMLDFQATFGYYPRSVGSWVLDAHSLGYLADRYGVVAACNCKDQWGTDGYTMWGGYWNQAYYPSRRNAFMPAQNAGQQIPVPIFRMLGSDPIYQYDLNLGAEAQAVVTLEPVYAAGPGATGGGGGSPRWVDWFFNVTFEQPCLGFAYTQAGQENPFGWPAMRQGLEYQIPRLAELARAGKARVETLEASGRWFRERYPVTPATAVVALTDWRGQGRKSAWFDSRYYRANLAWDDGAFRIRDIHLFDESYAERYLTGVCTGNLCVYDTLPVVDGYLWSTAQQRAGIRLVAVAEDGTRRPLAGGGPEVTPVGESGLEARWPLEGGAGATVLCAEERLSFEVSGGQWALELSWAAEKGSDIVSADGKTLHLRHEGFTYAVRCEAGRFEAAGASCILIRPEGGRVALDMRSRAE